MNKFFKSTLILFIGGLFTKVLGFIIKIFYTRILGSDGISLFCLVMPTYSLLLSIANFNIMLSVSKRISSHNSSKKVIINSCYIMFFLNLIIISLGLLFSKFISFNLLKNKYTLLPLLSCLITLPFVSIGYIIKGYFYGKSNVVPHMISNVLEQCFRLLIIFLLLPFLIRYGIVVAVSCLLLFNVLSESFSVFIFYFFLPKNFNISKEDLVCDKNEIRSILDISLPSIAGRLLCNVGYFFEPIILTNLLLFKGFDINYINSNYGIYNGYSLPLLLFPSFFISAISNALLPEICKNSNNKFLIKKRVKESVILSLTFGSLCTIFIFVFKSNLLSLLFNNIDGISFINVLAPFFILFYLEGPISTCLVALNKIKISVFVSVSGCIFKLLFMSILCIMGFGIYSLIYSEIFNIIYVVLLDIYFLSRVLNDI